MEQNDEEALNLWNWFKEISVIEFERVYKLLGMSFDSYLGESFYRDKVLALAEQLKQKNLLVESKGAQVIDLEQYNMPPCLITKSDGSSIYHSRDIAAILYRKEHVLNFEGTTGSYVQYMYARAKSILRKYGKSVDNTEIDYAVLADDVSYSLIKVLNGYEEAINNAAEKNEPSIVARYIIALATAFNKFYHECSILQAEEKEKMARLLLTDLVQKALWEACGLLGMECPEEM